MASVKRKKPSLTGNVRWLVLGAVVAEPDVVRDVRLLPVDEPSLEDPPPLRLPSESLLDALSCLLAGREEAHESPESPLSDASPPFAAADGQLDPSMYFAAMRRALRLSAFWVSPSFPPPMCSSCFVIPSIASVFNGTSPGEGPAQSPPS
eukprot:CAMPEP_0114119334 /NCGR_PEP_ID=MMETSP0043_2-20121206/6064_1 /TAXON_ID=464988 /ORGANISM="Hemiselmis andersenii, Strain CCMP644" /LENGTH=149 /DNA_ID=CAMNT_0001211891 /DNA_START=362 /DNA_END=808 /DNA_ORIENTATION=+